MTINNVTTRQRPGIIGMGPSLELRPERGCVQTFRPGGAAGSTVAAAFSFVNTWTTDEPYTAVRFEYSSHGTTGYTIAAAKTAATALHSADGTGLSYSNITFDKSATALAGDSWDGLPGSTPTYAVPARVSGSGANCVPARIWSDWVAQTPIESQEPDYKGKFIVNVRSYVSTTGYQAQQFGTSASNMGDYNTNSRRKAYGQILAGDQVTAITALTPLAAHQWMLVTGFQALLMKPVYNHGMFGDSITKGSGSFDINNGLWGWAHRAPQALMDAGLGTHSVVNYGVSGQSKIWTNALFLTVIREANLDTAIMFPWSPNNAGGSSPWALNDFLFQIYAALAECKKYGTALIVATQPPSSFITDVPGDLIRKANNATIRGLTSYGITVADFDAVVSDTALPARFIAGFSGDNIHPNTVGYEAMSAEYQRAIREALGI